MRETKLAAALLGTAVAFEVDGLDADRHTGWSIVVHGRAEEVSGVEELLEAEDLGIKTWANRDKSRFVRIHPTEVTGRRIPGHD
ncbi:MAG: pyridoxamine 5'-phosphate oxidase family protein [Acidimicrobiales bacterium]